MIEALVTKQQRVEMQNGLGNFTVKRPVRARDVEANLSPKERAIRRKLIVERHGFLDTLMVERPYHWINKVKDKGRFKVVDSGEELVPLPSARKDGQIHSWVYRVWFGHKWLPIATASDGLIVEAQVRQYCDSMDEFSSLDNERQPIDMGIHTRLNNVFGGIVGSNSEAFAFTGLVPAGTTLGEGECFVDITYRGDSMALDAPEWPVLDGTLVMLHQGFTGKNGSLPTLDNLSRLAITS